MCGSLTGSAFVVSSAITCRLAVNKRVRGEGRAPRGLLAHQQFFQQQRPDVATTVRNSPFRMRRAGCARYTRTRTRTRTAATHAPTHTHSNACTRTRIRIHTQAHHHLHTQASNADSRVQRLQIASASSANQGRPTHQPTKQSCSNLQATAQETSPARYTCTRTRIRTAAPHTPTHQRTAHTAHAYAQQRSHTHSHTHSHTSTGRLRKPRRPTGVRPSKGDGCPHPPINCASTYSPWQRSKPTTAADRQGQQREHAELQAPSLQEYNHRLHQEASNMASTMHEFKGC